MVCDAIATMQGLSDLLVWPTTCDYFFWLKVIFVLTFLIAWRIIVREEDKVGKGDFLSAAAVSSLGFTILAGFGTLISNSSGIPMIQTDIIMYLLAITLPLNIIWIFRKL